MALFGNNQSGGEKPGPANNFGRKLNFSDSLKYVDDYKIELAENKKGKLRRTVTYIGIWYAIKNNEKSARTKLFIVLALGIIAAGCLVGMLLNWNSADVWLPVTVPKAVALLPMLYLLMGVSELPYKLKPMHRAKYYHSFIRISRSGVGVLAFVGVSIVAEIVYRFVYKAWDLGQGEWLSFMFAGVLIASVVATIKLLYSIEIDELPNSAYKPEKL